MQHATCNVQHATCNMQRATCNMRLARPTERSTVRSSSARSVGRNVRRNNANNANNAKTPDPLLMRTLRAADFARFSSLRLPPPRARTTPSRCSGTLARRAPRRAHRKSWAQTSHRIASSTCRDFVRLCELRRLLAGQQGGSNVSCQTRRLLVRARGAKVRSKRFGHTRTNRTKKTKTLRISL